MRLWRYHQIRPPPAPEPPKVARHGVFTGLRGCNGSSPLLGSLLPLSQGSNDPRRRPPMVGRRNVMAKVSFAGPNELVAPAVDEWRLGFGACTVSDCTRIWTFGDKMLVHVQMQDTADNASKCTKLA